MATLTEHAEAIKAAIKAAADDGYVVDVDVDTVYYNGNGTSGSGPARRAGVHQSHELGLHLMVSGWGPVGQPNMNREQRIDMIRQLLQQEKAEGGQILLYPGKNRTLVVLSNNKDVCVIAEAHDG